MTSLRRLLLSLLLAIGLGAAAVPVVAQVDLTVVPAMTRGPEAARVTIVEFLDYE